MKKSKVKIVMSFLLVIVLAMGLVACGSANETPAANDESQNDDAQQATTDDGGEKKTFAIIYPIIHPFFEPVTEAAEAYAKEMGYELLIKAPEVFDVQKQLDIVENIIAMKVDGFCIGSIDPEALAPLIDKAVEAGIPVITFDTDTPNSNRLEYVGTDNLEAGKHMGEVLVKQLGENGGKVIVSTGVPTQHNLAQRLEGVKSVIKDYPNIEVVDVQSGQGEANKTMEITENMINKHPDFDCFIGIDGTAGPAAIAVWKAKGLDKPIITFDNMPENIQGVKDGIVTSIISQRQWLWGKLILYRLNEACEGTEIPEYEDTKTVEITIDNVDDYMDMTWEY